MKSIKKELIIEEPGSCVIQLSEKEKEKLAKYLNFEIEQLKDLINKNEKIQRIKTNFGINEIIISELYDANYLIVGKKKLTHRVLEVLQK